MSDFEDELFECRKTKNGFAQGVRGIGIVSIAFGIATLNPAAIGVGVSIFVLDYISDKWIEKHLQKSNCFDEKEKPHHQNKKAFILPKTLAREKSLNTVKKQPRCPKTLNAKRLKEGVTR